jgi:hypothetical protein
MELAPVAFDGVLDLARAFWMNDKLLGMPRFISVIRIHVYMYFCTTKELKQVYNFSFPAIYVHMLSYLLESVIKALRFFSFVRHLHYNHSWSLNMLPAYF